MGVGNLDSLAGVEDHPHWHTHNSAGPRRTLLEVIVAPGPDLNTGGEDGGVGYSPTAFETSIAQERQQTASLNANTTVVGLCMLVIMPPMRMAK